MQTIVRSFDYFLIDIVAKYVYFVCFHDRVKLKLYSQVTAGPIKSGTARPIN